MIESTSLQIASDTNTKKAERVPQASGLPATQASQLSHSCYCYDGYKCINHGGKQKASKYPVAPIDSGELKHNHFCIHCDQTWAHPVCSLGYDVSKFHNCDQRKAYVKAMQRARQDNDAGCKYGCTRFPCAHGFRPWYPSPVVKPTQPTVAPNESIKFENDLADKPSAYSHDGILLDNDVSTTRKAWTKNKIECLADKLCHDTPWLKELIKENRR